jgi:hypothetical protein
MDAIPKRRINLLALSLALIITLLGAQYALPARADVGVQPILPSGSNIKPEGQMPIQMAAEKVIMTVRQGTDADNAAFKLIPGDLGYPYMPNPYFPIVYAAVADVTADFTMANPTDQDVSMTVWFPLASALGKTNWEELPPGDPVLRVENFRVAVDGKPISYRISELPNPQGEDKAPLPWASFPVTFPAKSEIPIHVSYVFLPQMMIDMVSMTIAYVFQTGAGWAGPIGKAELVVNLPYPASAETVGAMPDGGKIEGNQVRWTWENLEPGPQDDFSMFLLRPERWQELQDAQKIVKSYPDFAQGWLGMADLYQRLSQGYNERGHITSIFGETYQNLGVQAAQESARLNPEDIMPHYLLAMLYASTLQQNASPEQLQPVYDELEIMKKLDLQQAQGLEPNVYDILEPVLYNDATATAQAATWAAEGEYNDETAAADAALADAATKTAQPAGGQATETSSPPSTPTPASSSTQASAPIAQQIPQVTQPALTVIPAAAQPTQPSYIWMLVLALVIILAGVTYFILAKRRKSGP